MDTCEKIKYIYFLDISPSHFSSTEDLLCKLSILEPNILIVFSKQPSSELKKCLHQGGCRFSTYSLSYLIRNLRKFPDLQILIVGFTRLSFMEQIKLFLHRIQYVLVWHNSIYEDELTRKPFAKAKYFLKYLLVSHIISVSKTVLKFISVIGIPSKKATLIYNGVNFEKKQNSLFVALPQCHLTPLAYKKTYYPNLNVIFLYPKNNNNISLFLISNSLNQQFIDIDIRNKEKYHDLFSQGINFNAQLIFDKKIISNLKKLLVFKSLDIVHSIQNNHKNILFAGSLEDFKGFNLILDSLPELENFNIFVAGNGSLLNELKQSIKQYKNLFYLGEVNNLSQMYRYFDFVLLPSIWHESFCLIGVEAQQYGIHIIASRRGALPEVLKPELTTYLDELSKEALVGAIKKSTKTEKRIESLSNYTTTKQAKEYSKFINIISN
jgi:glycosyltransferase involved in cell wall biosynthesis